MVSTDKFEIVIVKIGTKLIQQNLRERTSGKDSNGVKNISEGHVTLVFPVYHRKHLVDEETIWLHR